MDYLGPRIREIRNRKGMTLETVAKKADISASSLSYIERGQNSPTAETMRKIADALGVTIGELLGIGPAVDHEVRPADDAERMPFHIVDQGRAVKRHVDVFLSAAPLGRPPRDHRPVRIA